MDHRSYLPTAKNRSEISTARPDGGRIRARVLRAAIVLPIFTALVLLLRDAGNLFYLHFPKTFAAAGGLGHALPWVAILAAGLAIRPEWFRVPWHVASAPGRTFDCGRDRRGKAGQLVVFAAVIGGTAILYRGAILGMVQYGVKLPPAPLALLSAALAWPVVEEWLFRGLLWRELGGGLAALLVTSLAFAWWHLPHTSSPLWVHFAFGVLMAVQRWRTGGILGCVLLHGAGNALGFFVDR